MARNSVVIDLTSARKYSRQLSWMKQSSAARTTFYEDDDEASNHTDSPYRRLKCDWLPCCMNEADAESFGHHVSIFMVALVAFATFFCVTFILVLVFLLG